MRLLCTWVLIVSIAGFCMGGAEERLSRRGRVTVTCTDGNNEMIQLWCNMEKLTCLSRGEDKNDQFAILEPYGNHLFRVRGQGGQNSDSITYKCHMIGTSVVPSSNVGSLYSENIPHGDPIGKKRQGQIRRARESDKNSRENSKENRAEKHKKDKDRGKKKKDKDKISKRNVKNEQGSNENKNPGHGGETDSAEDDDTEETDKDDHSNKGNQPGGGVGKDRNERSTIDTTHTTKSKTTTQGTSSKDGLYIVIIILMVVLLILAVCCFLLWKSKKKIHSHHKAAGSSAQAEPEKKVVTVYATANHPKEPTYTQPDRIYQEIADTPVNQARTPQNTPYSIVRLASQETGASQENIPYSVVSLASQGAGDPQNNAYCAVSLAPKEAGALA